MNRDPQRKPSRFLVGIDLGTTNSAVAFVDSQSDPRAIHIFSVPQFVGPGEVEPRETFPSFHYSPATGEFAGMRLPWQTEEPTHLTGILARDHGAAVPSRLITSAKSWLSHAGVDRTGKILPWHGAPDVEKLSPMEVSARFLAHIHAAWNHAHPSDPLSEQEVVITIPASFDEIARELTVAAAHRAHLPRVVLLEEPQAAFYAWIHAHGANWDQRLQPGHKILVCDVGGGTTDFTLIQVQPGDHGQIRFHRYAVGDHLILGGDNLDLALAHHLENRLSPTAKLDPRTWSILVRRCQHVKERLLSHSPPERLTINVPSASSRLIGSALSTELTHAEAVELLVNGFLPHVPLSDKPARRSSGFQEFGLPYAPDHAITRYLAAFLTAHQRDLPDQPPDSHAARPDIVLLNGGLFESTQMRDRLLQVLTSWFNADPAKPTWQPLVLENQRLDLAVAVGAAYFGMVRRGIGTRISGGLARSYYVGVQHQNQTAALCLVPAGLEEGHEIHLDKTFDLLIRQPVEFPLFISSARTTDQIGDIIPIDLAQLSALPPIRTVLRAGKNTDTALSVPVHLHARLTEIGTLEVWCAQINSPRKWKLQFDVRAATQTDVAAHHGSGERAGFIDEDSLLHCDLLLRRTFSSATPPLPPEQLVKAIEQQLALPRLEWPPSLLRRLWEILLDLDQARARSVQHEARWLSLTGFALRPGCGVALDDWRVAQTWRLFEKQVAHENNEMCRSEWWILWRRIAAGLVPGQQRVLADPLIAALRARARGDQKPSASRKSSAPFKFGSHETEEVWRLLGSLELLPLDLKLELGQMLLSQIERKGPDLFGRAALWALARIGARIPAYGPVNLLIPPETAELWLQRLLPILTPGPDRWFALMQLARRTGDRYRDISSSTQSQVLAFMRQYSAPAHLTQLVLEPGHLLSTEQDELFGEALPPGLRLSL